MPGIGNIRARKFGKIGFAVDTDAQQVSRAVSPLPNQTQSSGIGSATKSVSVGLSDNQNTIVAEVVERAIDLIEQKKILVSGPPGPQGPIGPSGEDGTILEYDVGDLTLYFENKLI